ncbi:hypothetical protein IKR55_04685 [bacterium]|nr:hypothetical protein [bacterium]
MKVYKIFTISALLLCSTIGVAFAQNYWCSSDGFGYLATVATPETSCIATKGSPDTYKSCVENLRKNNEKTKADLQKGICKPIQEKQASYGQTKCKYFYIIENGKVEDRGNESFSLSKNSEFEKDKCLQIAKEEVSKTVPTASSTKSAKWADQNLSTQSKPKPVSMTTSGSTTSKTYTPTKTYTKPSYKYNFPPQYAPAQGYKNPSDAYKK